MIDTEPLEPDLEGMEAYIVERLVAHHKGTPPTEDEQDTMAEYAMIMAVMNLYRNGLSLDLAMDVVEQANSKGEIKLVLRVDGEGYVLDITVGDQS